MKTLLVIPARYASTRFPGKPLIDIGGKTMIARVYEQASRVKSASCIVATDDVRIEQHVLSFGGKVMMTSEQHTNGTERCAEVVQKMNEKVDFILNVQGDEPFIKPEQIELLISGLKPETKIATLIKKITNTEDIHSPNTVKAVTQKNGDVLYFSRHAIPYNRDSSAVVYYKHIGLYAYRADVLPQLVQLKPTALEQAEKLEQLRWLENGFTIRAIETTMETISIDTPEDLKKIEM